MDVTTTASNNMASVMQRHWKRYLLLIALVAVLLYVGWRVYEDYELRSYPQRVADSIPMPEVVYFSFGRIQKYSNNPVIEVVAQQKKYIMFKWPIFRMRGSKIPYANQKIDTHSRERSSS
jgi:hypothetical protein